MKYIILFLLLISASQSYAKKIKLTKSNDYYKSLKAQAIDITPQKPSIKKKINNLYPLAPFRKPSLNGNFSKQFAYKNSQRTIKLTADDQSIQN